MNREYLKITFVLAAAMTLIAGCATERHIAPTLSEPPRADLDLRMPPGSGLE